MLSPDASKCTGWIDRKYTLCRSLVDNINLENYLIANCCSKQPPAELWACQQEAMYFAEGIEAGLRIQYKSSSPKLFDRTEKGHCTTVAYNMKKGLQQVRVQHNEFTTKYLRWVPKQRVGGRTCDHVWGEIECADPNSTEANQWTGNFIVTIDVWKSGVGVGYETFWRPGSGAFGPDESYGLDAWMDLLDFN